MGVGTRSVIVVGYTYDEIYEIYQAYEDVIDFNEWYEDNGLESFSPYYDASREDCLFGIRIYSTGCYSFKALDINELDITGTRRELATKFSIVPTVYLSPYVW